MAGSETKGVQRPGPAQAEGPDEEAGEGLERHPGPAASGAPDPQGRDKCKEDKDGIAH